MFRTLRFAQALALAAVLLGVLPVGLVLACLYLGVRAPLAGLASLVPLDPALGGQAPPHALAVRHASLGLVAPRELNHASNLVDVLALPELHHSVVPVQVPVLRGLSVVLAPHRALFLVLVALAVLVLPELHHSDFAVLGGLSVGLAPLRALFHA